MAFHLQIVTPDRMCFDGEADRIIVRTVRGDICVMSHHVDYVAPLGIGQAKVVDAQGNTRYAACAGGLIGVDNGNVRVLPTTFEWEDEIDLDRAERAKEITQEKIKGMDREADGFAVLNAKLQRALTRIQVHK